MKFDKLVISIQDTHEELQRSTVKAVNQALTVRNWLIGLYIVEFEQKGKDRAKYGERLLPELSESVKIRDLSVTNLRLCRQFYTAYPHLLPAVKEVLNNHVMQVNRIGQTMTDQLQETDLQIIEIHQSITDELNRPKRNPNGENGHLVDPLEILSKISFTHLVQLLTLHDMNNRTFYELECIERSWSVDELKRQINTLYYERSGISKNRINCPKLSTRKHNMYTKLKYLTYFSLIALLFNGCSKDDNDTDAVVKLENTTWVATMTDDNPSTNPFGEFGMNGLNQYYPWSECHMDDSFIFLKDRLSINDNGTVCDDGLDLIFETKNQPYSYNPETKKLTVGSGDDVAVLDVYELNKDRLKLGLTIPTGTGFGNIVFLFKRK